MATIKAKKGKKGTTYYLVYSFQETARSGSTQNKVKWVKVGATKTEAETALREFNREHKKNRFAFNRKESILFDTFVTSEFLPWCKTRKSEDSYNSTQNALLRIGKFWGKVTLQDLSVYTIERYITWRKQNTTNGKLISNRTVNIDLIYLSQCLKQARMWRLIPENPCDHVQKLKESKGRLRFFSREEVQHLLQQASPHIKRFLMVGLCTGMRYSEILNLKLSQIDLNHQIIHLENTDAFQTKNRKNRDVPISPLLLAHIQEYMSTWADPNGGPDRPRTHLQKTFLFCHKNGLPIKSMRTAYRNLLKHAGVKGATIHTMRHSYASHLVMNGVGIRTVQELLGHSSIGVTEIYAHLTTAHKQEAVQLLQY